MDIDYNKIKIFLEIVRSGGITAAAKGLHRTQSAISQSLQNLEKQLGITLIEWKGKQLKLTRAGHTVFQAADNRMASIEELLNTLLTSGDQVAGCIEIGLLQDQSTGIQETLLKAIASFRKKYPAVTFQIRFGTSYEIEEALLNRELDLGFSINFRERHRFHVVEVAKEEHIIVSSTPYNTIEEMLKADLIDIDESFTCFTPWIQKHAPSLLSLLDDKLPVIAIPDFRAIKDLVLAGQGVAVLPKYLVEKSPLVQILPELETLLVSVDLAYERGRPLRPCEELFVHHI